MEGTEECNEDAKKEVSNEVETVSEASSSANQLETNDSVIGGMEVDDVDDNSLLETTGSSVSETPKVQSTDVAASPYASGDIVWVKWRSSWWPAEVTDDLPEDLEQSFQRKKRPLCVVRFFNEDFYETIKNSANICPYNCERKGEFIKKGMDLYRAKNLHMEKFPVDVTLAEMKTNGNPNILSEPAYMASAQPRRSKILSEIFRNPKQTPSKSGSSGSGAGGSSSSTEKSKRGRKAAASSLTAREGKDIKITHRRWLGLDDFKCEIRMQPNVSEPYESDCDDEDVINNTIGGAANTTNNNNNDNVIVNNCDNGSGGNSEEAEFYEIMRQLRKSALARKRERQTVDQVYPCSLCSFETSRIEVMLHHAKMDHNSVAGSEKKTSPKKKKRTSTVTPRKPTNATNDDSSETKKRKNVEKKSEKGAKRQKKSTATVDGPKNDGSPSTENRDESEVVVAESEKAPAEDIRGDLLAEWSDEEEISLEQKIVEKEVVPDLSEAMPSEPPAKKSCFDFSDSEEGENEKIVPLPKVPPVVVESNREADKKIDAEIEKIDEFLATSVVPPAPQSLQVDVPKVNECTFSATKLTNPKKRFVKSFEEDLQKAAKEEEETKSTNSNTNEIVAPIQEEEEKLEKSLKEKEDDAENKDGDNEDDKEINDDKGVLEKDEEVIETLEKRIEAGTPTSSISGTTTKTNSPIEPQSQDVSIAKLKNQLMAKLNTEEDEKKTLKRTTSTAGTKKTESEEDDDDDTDDDNDDEDELQTKRSKLSTEDEESIPSPPPPAVSATPPRASPSPSPNSSKPASPVSQVVEVETVPPKENVENEIESITKDLVESVCEEVIKKDEEIQETPAVQPQIESVPELVPKTTTQEPQLTHQQQQQPPLEDDFDDFLNNLTKKEEISNLEPVNFDVEKSNTSTNTLTSTTTTTTSTDDDNVDDDDEPKEKPAEEFSALLTLAGISSTKLDEKQQQQQQQNQETTQTEKPEPGMVPIDGATLTVFSEKELADTQIEIISSNATPNKKPVTLTNFSLEPTPTPSPLPVVKSVPPPSSPTTQISTKTTLQEPQPQKSMLHERLTVKSDNKVGQKKFVIKSVTPGTSAQSGTAVGTAANTKPVILSETILKPDKIDELNTSGSTPSTNVSVQKISTKRTIQDIEEIDTFVIQKTASTVKAVDEELKPKPPRIKVMAEPKKFLPSILQQQQQPPKKVVHKTSGTSGTIGAGKAKILNQTIITPSGEIIQPIGGTRIDHSSHTITATGSGTGDEFDINSMPIVLGDQILTAESLDSMPIFLEETITTPNRKIVSTQIQKKMIQKISGNSSSGSGSVAGSSSGNTVVVGNMVSPTPALLQQTKSKVISGTITAGGAGQKKTLIKHTTSFAPGSSASKHGKYIVMTQPHTGGTSGTLSTAASGVSQAGVAQTSRFTVGKRPNKRVLPAGGSAATVTGGGTTVIGTVSGGGAGVVKKIDQSNTQQSGNKIMILTNQQGKQHKLLLTPAQQKLIGVGGGTVIAQTPKSLIKTTLTPQQQQHQQIYQRRELLTSQSGVKMLVPHQRYASSGGISSGGIGSKLVRIDSTKIGSASHKSNPARNVSSAGQVVPHKKMVRIQQQTQPVQQHQQQQVLPPRRNLVVQHDEKILEAQVAEQLEAINKASTSSAGVAVASTGVGGTVKFSKPPEKSYRRSYAMKKQGPRILESSPTAVSAPVPVPAPTPPPPLSPLASATPATSKDVPSLEVSQGGMVPGSVQSAAGTSGVAQSERPLHQLVIQDALGNQTTITEGQILALPSETVEGHAQSYMLVTLDESGNLTPLNNEELASLDPTNTVLQIDQHGIAGGTESEAIGGAEVKKTEEKTEECIVKERTVVGENNLVLPVVPQLSGHQETAVVVPQSVQQEQSVAAAQQEQQLIVTGDPVAAQKFLDSLSDGTNTDLANILASAEGSSILIHADGQQILINTTGASGTAVIGDDGTTDSGAEVTTQIEESASSNVFVKNQDILAAALADTDMLGVPQTVLPLPAQAQQPHPAAAATNVVLETSLTLNTPIMTPLEVPSSGGSNSGCGSTTSGIDTCKTMVLPLVDTNQPCKDLLPITVTDPQISHIVNETTSAAFNSSGGTNSSYSMPLLEADDEQMKQQQQQQLQQQLNEGKAKEDSDVCDTHQLSTKTTMVVDDDGLNLLGGEMCSSLSEPPPDMFDLTSVVMSAAVAASGVAVESSSASNTNGNVTSASTPSTTPDDSSNEIPLQPEIVMTSSTTSEATTLTTTTTSTTTSTPGAIASSTSTIMTPTDSNDSLSSVEKCQEERAEDDGGGGGVV